MLVYIIDLIVIWGIIFGIFWLIVWWARRGKA